MTDTYLTCLKDSLVFEVQIDLIVINEIEQTFSLLFLLELSDRFFF